jgi:hypothetical protein
MSHPNQLVVVAALLDTTQLTLYKEDGSTISIPQGDGRIQRILDVCQPALKKLGDKVTVDLSAENHYAAFEEKTGGLVRLFRVAKAKVAEFFSKTEVEAPKPITLGIVPTAKDVPAMTAVVTKRPQRDEQGEVITPLASAVAEIMAHATPVASKDFLEPVAKHEDREPDTMIAVVAGQVIPDVDKLKPQFAAASQATGSTKGIEALLSRMAKIIGKRRHSVEDLLHFLKRGDLPVADDGSIIIYKILKRKVGEKDTFVDCHSGNVPQKVGSYVCMDEAMVDPSQRTECSQGLHVARRGYLRSFPGDVVTLCKIMPEDVIAVPHGEADKMRVCGYHILALLSHDSFTKLKAGKPMTDNTADQALLGRVLSGDHIGILERVEIGGPKGSNITITPLHQKAGERQAPVAKPRLAEALPDNGHVAPAIDVKEVAKQVTAAKEEQKDDLRAEPQPRVQPDVVNNPPYLPVVEQALAEAKPMKKVGLKASADTLYQLVLSSIASETKATYAAELVKFKKDKKKAWTDLGLTDAIGTSLLEIAKDKLPQKGAIFTNEATIAKAEKKVIDVAAGLPKKAPRNDDKMIKPVVKVTPRSQIAELLRTAPTTESAHQIVKIKKTAKKSWDALGVTPSEVSTILELTSTK